MLPRIEISSGTHNRRFSRCRGKASATFPTESRSPAIPEPTTSASRNAVPTNSALTGLFRLNLIADRRCPGSVLNAGLSMEASGRQRKRPIRRSSRKKASGKALCPSSGVPTTAAGSGTPPMCSHRLARPYPANLVRGIITDGENKIEFCGICFRKLVLTPAAKSTCRNMCDFKLTQCLWAHLS